MEKQKPIPVGLIGYGVAGRIFHAPFINHLGEFILAAIHTNNPQSIEEINARYPGCIKYNTVDELLDNPFIECVIIAAPNQYHAPIAAKALQAGKHVVVDKPFTITTIEADELIAIAGSHSRILTVYHNRRLDGDFKTVQNIIASGTAGKLNSFESRFERFRPQLKQNAWREESIPGAGILYDLGSHLIDQSLVLFGMPSGIRADIRIQRPAAIVDDFFSIQLVYNDVLVSLHASMLVLEKQPRFTLKFDSGTFIKHGLDPQEAQLKDGLSLEDPQFGIEQEEFYGIMKNDAGFEIIIPTEPGNYIAFFLQLHEAIRNNTSPIVKPEEARNVIRLIELARESSSAGKEMEVNS